MSSPNVTRATLCALYPFARVGEERLNDLLPLCHRERFTKTIDPFRQRDFSGHLLYLIRGELKLVQQDGVVRVLVGGSDRALFPISQAGQVPLSGKAITDIEILRVEEEAADILVAWDQYLDGSGAVSVSEWTQMSGIFAAQSITRGVFSMLPTAHIGMLLDRFQREPHKRGEIIVRQGDQGEYYYLIERGCCIVSREFAGSSVDVAELQEGEAFGADALVSDMPRNATVTMKADGVLLKLRKTDFDELLREPLMHKLGVAAAVSKVARGALWIDVRFAPEFQHDGLPGAMNIPLNELRESSRALNTDREYVVYCQTGRRSAAAAFLLAQRGFRAYLLDGGLRALGGDDIS